MFNTSIGSFSMLGNTTGSSNVAIGKYALLAAEQNSGNIAIGDSTLFYYNNASNTDLIVAIGYNSSIATTKGFFNTAIGGASFQSNTTGAWNTAIGTAALNTNATGNLNTMVGAGADVNAATLNNATAIGYLAICDASNKVRIGNTNVTSIGGQVTWSTFSDGRYKKNIKENIPGLAFIKMLKPISYTVDVNGLDNYFQKNQKQNHDYRNNEAEKSAKDAASKIIYNGFVAQDVEVAAKKLNYDFSGVDKPQTKDGLYGLRYSDFVVPLVKAVQELSKMNDEKDTAINQQNIKINDLQNQINKLKAMLTPNQSTIHSTQSATVSSASLQQNIPNPFNQTTTINYALPQTYSSAKIMVTDKSGKLLKEFSLSAKGKGSLYFNAATLFSGAYQYSLYVDGKFIDTKQLLLQK